MTKIAIGLGSLLSDFSVAKLIFLLKFLLLYIALTLFAKNFFPRQYHWYSAVMGDADDQFNFVVMYANGNGVTQNDDKC